MPNSLSSRSRIALGLVLAQAAIGSATVFADPPRRPHMQQAEVGITDSSPGKPASSTTFLLQLTEGRPSGIEARGAGDIRYNVKVQLQAVDGPRAEVSCEMLRFENAAKLTVAEAAKRAVAEAHFYATVILTPGHQVTVSRVVRPDGTKVEVMMTLR